MMEITDRQCRLRAFPAIKHALRTQKNIGKAVSRSAIRREVRYRFGCGQKLQTRCGGELYDFV